MTDYPEVNGTYGVEPVLRPSTNFHYVNDTADDVAKLAEQEYSEKNTFLLNCFYRIRSLAWEAAQNGYASRVLVVGCATGRLCFELSKVFRQVLNVF